jgi:hypothetical protein
MKMQEANLRKKLCRTFCKYYKPSKKEELSCMGFRVIERLILRGDCVPFGEFAVVPGRLTQETLVQEMCAFCPFYDDDCDFVKGKEHSTACGGFILLARLLETRVIAVDNIRDVR